MVEKDDISNSDLSKSLGTMEDWYRAVIFDPSLNVLAKKNIEKINQDELK